MTINPNNKFNENHVTLNELIQVLKQLGTTTHIEKGKCILTVGEKVDIVFFVEKGCFRTFRYIDDEEVTIGFSFQGDLDTCPFAYINQLKSSDCIEALTDSKVIKVHLVISLLTSQTEKYPLFIRKILIPISVCLLGFSVTSFIYFFYIPAVTSMLAYIFVTLSILSLSKHK